MPMLGLETCNQIKAPLSVKVQQGKNYFIRQNLTSTSNGTFLVPAGGVMVPASNDVVIYVGEVVKESTGREEVAKCRQVGTNVRF